MRLTVPTFFVAASGLGGDKTELAGPAPGLRNAVELFGLKKVFPHNPCGAWGCCCCCASSKDARSFWALKGSWFGIAENQLFCLLGPNGAGKSTIINCLTGEGVVLCSSHGVGPNGAGKSTTINCLTCEGRGHICAVLQPRGGAKRGGQVDDHQLPFGWGMGGGGVLSQLQGVSKLTTIN